MKIIAYSVRPDELLSFENFSKQYGHEVTIRSEIFSPETAALSEGHDGVLILGNDVANREALEIISSFGIKYLSTRSAGTNNIDLIACKELGIKATNVPAYSPNSVSEFTVGATIALTRKLNESIKRTQVQNFALNGLIGIELKNLTIGIIGAGRIGSRVVKAFSGFGCKIIVNDLVENDEVKRYAEYTSKEDLYAQADIISLHLPLDDTTKYLINDDTINMMKDGVIIINPARGSIIDTNALISGLKSGKIRGAALDTYENEVGIFHYDYTNNLIKDDLLARLLQFPNVLITPHYAFYTDEAVSNMVEVGLLSMRDFQLKGESENEIY